MERCGEKQRKLEKVSEKAVKSGAIARGEGMGLDTLRAGSQGAMGLDMRVCPKCGDTLHPLGFTHHVSKVCSVCGVSMNRESIPRHETMCWLASGTDEKKNHQQEGTWAR